MFTIKRSVGLGFEGMENDTYTVVYKDGRIYANRYNNEPWEFFNRGDNEMLLTRSKAWHIADHLTDLPEWVEKALSLSLEDECHGICYLLDMSTRTIISKVRK